MEMYKNAHFNFSQQLARLSQDLDLSLFRLWIQIGREWKFGNIFHWILFSSDYNRSGRDLECDFSKLSMKRNRP